MTSEQKGVDVLAAKMFDAYAINSGYNPAEHFNRDAGNQWMGMALVECGIAHLIESHARLLNLCYSCGLPKCADDLMPLAEARRVIAMIENKERQP